MTSNLDMKYIISVTLSGFLWKVWTFCCKYLHTSKPTCVVLWCTGRCMPNDHGTSGCQHDVINLLDVQCSGKQNCSFEVPGIGLKHINPCERGLTSYLEADYRCVRGKLFDDGVECRRTCMRVHRNGYIRQISLSGRMFYRHYLSVLCLNHCSKCSAIIAKWWCICKK